MHGSKNELLDDDRLKLPSLGSATNSRAREITEKAKLNEELLHEVVLKKIKEQIKPEAISHMTPIQVKLHIRTVAEEAISHFKSLKGLLTETLVQKYFNYVSKMMREKAQTARPLPPVTGIVMKKQIPDDRSLVNYDMTEMALLKDLEFTVGEVKEIRQRKTDLDQETYTRRKEAAFCREKV